MPLRLDRKVALVTGGSAGIERAAALAFTREGARVAICARNQTAGDETVGMIRRRGLLQKGRGGGCRRRGIGGARARDLRPARLRIQQRRHHGDDGSRRGL